MSIHKVNYFFSGIKNQLKLRVLVLLTNHLSVTTMIETVWTIMAKTPTLTTMRRSSDNMEKTLRRVRRRLKPTVIRQFRQLVQN